MSPAMPRVFSLPPDLRQRAWKALVKELGIVDATRFVMAVEPGEGDSVEKYAQLWDGMTLEAVHDEILKARERGELAPYPRRLLDAQPSPPGASRGSGRGGAGWHQ